MVSRTAGGAAGGMVRRSPVGGFYRTLTMDGEPVARPGSEGAGPCGTYFPVAGPH